MKKRTVLLFVLLFVLSLAACGPAQDTPASAPDQAAEAAPPELPGPEETGTDDPEEAGDVHTHRLSDGGNVLEHENAGYCGNTVTTVICRALNGGESWTRSFWGDESVELTDLLRYLDYSGDLCRCRVEYTVDTELGQDYGVNLTEGFVRWGDGQVSLTEEQLERVTELLNRAAALPEEQEP